MRIATTTRAHDLGYGFLLTKVFEHFGVELRKKVDAQAIDEVGSSTIMGCYTLLKPCDQRTDQGAQTPVCQCLIAVEIKVCKHLLRLFLQQLLLCRSPLLQPLPHIRGFGLISRHCSGSFKKRKRWTPRGMPISSPFSKPSNLNPLTLEILFHGLFVAMSSLYLSCFWISCSLNNCLDCSCLSILTCIGYVFADFALWLLLDFCAYLRMANHITVPRLKCIAGWIFTITKAVMVANTLFPLILTCSFRWCQKGED